MRKSLLLYCLTILPCLLWPGCRSAPDRSLAVEQALELAGPNAEELTKVLHHYQESGEPLKLEAARFLIAHMPGKYTLTHEHHEHYRNELPRLAYGTDDRPAGEPSPRALLDSLGRAYPLSSYTSLPDIRTITAGMLISNIDLAFQEWEAAPWSGAYTFEEFCEWVLPYRTHNERLENWRAAALAARFEQEDSVLMLDSTILRMGVFLINNTRQRYDEIAGRYPFPLSFIDMQVLRKGACMELSEYATRLFRSRGVPASTEMVPVWGNRGGSHAWNAIILPQGECEGMGYHRRGILEMDNKIPKVYRRRYSLAPDDPLSRYGDSEPVPAFFRDGDMLDVTARYNLPVSDVEITGMKPAENRIAWLCCFNNFDWTPVAYAEIKKEKALFKDMGRGAPLRRHTEIGKGVMTASRTDIPYADLGEGIVYLPAYYSPSRRVYPAADPVILQHDGRIRPLKADLHNRQTITVTRKYPRHDKFRDFLQRMNGGRFEGANRPDFSDAVTLHVVRKEQPEPFTTYAADASGPFRYVRYVAPDSTYGNLSELRFFSGERQLSGKPIGTPGTLPAHGPQAAFDENILSYFLTDVAEGAWVGLDLGKPVGVTSLSYHARTDENEIYPGETYELRYWDDEWHILGQKTAEGYALEWTDVPTGTIYYIRHTTKGVEQRIFTYENGRQVFW